MHKEKKRTFGRIMTKAVVINEAKGENYELVQPEGGWGYVVALGSSIVFTVTVVPMSAFGIIFGKFLASLGDEIGGTTLVNGLFNTVLSATGVLANQLLQKYSWRKVGYVGATLFFLGSFGTAFVTSLNQMIFTFGVLQGVGFGLLLPVAFGIINEYFEHKRNMMMGLSQTLVAAATLVVPVLSEYCMLEYGFRGTAAIIGALSLNNFVAVLTFQPVKHHMKKRRLLSIELQNVLLTKINDKNADNSEKYKLGAREEGRELLQEYQELPINKVKTVSLNDVKEINGKTKLKNGKRTGVWNKMAKSLDLALFKDPVYVNISFGLALGVMSDLIFLSILPILLTQFGFSASEITVILTAYFVADLVSRIAFSVISAVIRIWNRYAFLAAMLLTICFRTAFLHYADFWWILSTCSLLGFLRGFIQIPLPLVIAEQYGPRFTTAFSLYMVVCGFVSLAIGVLSGIVKDFTGSDLMVAQLLTLLCILCAIPWLLEMFYKKMVKKS